MDDRAVSDTVGFVLAFALITTTIALVFTGGFGALQDAQQAEQVNNVERAFDVLSHNFEEIYYRDASSRTMELRLGDGHLSYADRSEITVYQGDENQNVTIRPNPIVYEAEGDSQIVYEAGAVFRTDGGNSVMINEPPFRLDEDRTTLSFVETVHTGDQATVSGDRTVLVRGRTLPHDRTTTVPEFDENESVTIVVNSPRSDAWERYFEDLEIEGDVDPNREGNTVTYEFDTEELNVPQTLIRVRTIS